MEAATQVAEGVVGVVPLVEGAGPLEEAEAVVAVAGGELTNKMSCLQWKFLQYHQLHLQTVGWGLQKQLWGTRVVWVPALLETPTGMHRSARSHRSIACGL